MLLFCGSVLLPDTPNSLVARGMPEEGRAVLKRIRGTEQIDAEYEDIIDNLEQSKNAENPYLAIIKRRHWPQLVICLLCPFFQQFSGINAVMFYSPQMFEAAGQGSSDALLNTVIMGSVNVASTIVAILLVDRLGRRFLFLEGGSQMVACLVIVGILIKLTNEQPDNAHLASAVVGVICIYVAGFAWSWGPLAWLVPTGRTGLSHSLSY